MCADRRFKLMRKAEVMSMAIDNIGQGGEVGANGPSKSSVVGGSTSSLTAAGLKIVGQPIHLALSVGHAT
jgi:hypothetical protein